MKKKNAVQTISIPSAHSNNTLIHQTSNVSAKITLSDSILSGAVIEYRKAGYNFIRHLHTNIEIYRILSGFPRSARLLNVILISTIPRILR